MRLPLTDRRPIREKSCSSRPLARLAARSACLRARLSRINSLRSRDRKGVVFAKFCRPLLDLVRCAGDPRPGPANYLRQLAPAAGKVAA
jgi:hypothetical protein